MIRLLQSSTVPANKIETSRYSLENKVTSWTLIGLIQFVEYKGSPNTLV